MANDIRDLINSGVDDTREIKTGKAPIKFTVDAQDFTNGFKALNKEGNDRSDEKNWLNDLKIKTFDGRVSENPNAKDGTDGKYHGGTDCVVKINFAKLSNLSAGATGKRYDDPAIKIESLKDQATGNVVKYAFDMDLGAVADANTAAKLAAANGNEKRESAIRAQSGRVPVTYGYKVAKDGVCAVSNDTLTKVVGQAATQNYVLSASKKDPNGVFPKDADVQKLGNEMTAMFEDAVKKATTGKWKNSFQAQDGTSVEASAVDKLKIKSVASDAGNVYVIEANSLQDANKQLTDFSTRFNLEKSGTINQTYPKTDDKAFSLGRTLGNGLKLNAYAVAADGVSGEGKYQVHPAFDFQTSPYAGSLKKAVDAYTNHDVGALENIYGKDILDNLDTLNAKYNAPTGRTKAEAQAVVDKNRSQVISGANITGVQTPEGPEGPEA